MTIRRFRKEDLRASVELIHTTIKLCYPSVYPPEVVNFFLEYHSADQLLLKAAKGELYLITEGENIIGTGYLIKDEIGGVYIHPEEQKKGYGKKIMEYLIRIAVNKGLERIWLDATPLSKPLYDHMRFTLVRKACDMIGDQPLDYYVMEKWL